MDLCKTLSFRLCDEWIGPILASLRNKRFSYVFCRSNFLITMTFGSENSSEAACYDVFLVAELLPPKFWLFRVNQFSGGLPSKEKREFFGHFWPNTGKEGVIAGYLDIKESIEIISL